MLSSIIDMLKQLMGQSQQVEEPMEPMEVMEQIADTSPEEEIKKEKKVDGKIGDEDAETRLGDQTPITDNALSDIGKSLVEIKSIIAGKNNQVRKAKAAQNSNMNGLKAIMEVVKSLAEKQNNQEQAFSQFMQNIGVSDDIVKKALETPTISTTPESRPVQQTDMVAFMTEVMKNMNNNTQTNWPSNKLNDPWRNREDVNKNLDPVLDYLLKK